MSIENELKELHDCSKLVSEQTIKRNKLIVEARIAGWPWQTIAEATGLSISGLHKIAKSLNNGILPIPKRLQKPKFD